MSSISSLSNFGPDQNHLANGGQVDSTGSSDTSSIRRPGSSGSDDKKRSAPANAGQNGVQSEAVRSTQPAQPAPERKYQPYNFAQEQMPGHSYNNDTTAQRWTNQAQAQAHPQQAQNGQAQHGQSQQAHQQQQQQQQSGQQGHAQSQLPMGVSQEQAQSMMYGRGNFPPQYQQAHGGQMQDSAEWTNFFQSNGQDPLMYTSQ